MVYFVQVYDRLNHVNMCISYPGTLSLITEISSTHTVPLQKWIADGAVIKFWGDNVNMKQHVRDERSDHQGQMLNTFSVLVGRSRTPAPSLSHTGHSSKIHEASPDMFLLTCEDIAKVKSNLVVLVSRVLTTYFSGLAPLSKAFPKHISHAYSIEMSKKSEVIVLDVLMKDETKHADMIDIMSTMQEYLGSDFNEERRVLCGGDLLTCERQIGSQKHMMCGNTPRERLQILEPVAEDWHCLVSLIGVSHMILHINVQVLQLHIHNNNA